MNKFKHTYDTVIFYAFTIKQNIKNKVIELLFRSYFILINITIM